MNNFIKLFCGAAAATMMFSCSSDEPANTPENGNVSADGVAYLAVNIQDANSSRALRDNIGDADEGDYIYGDAEEHAVANAHFYFYDANGVFVTEANVWTGGSNGTGNENIEYIGDNVLVLRNLKQDNLPVYLVTVLNVPTDFKPTPRLEDMAKQQLVSFLSGNNFIMSTTSFVNNNNSADYESSDKKLYFANKLKSTDFSKEPITDANASTVHKVDIFVERLAAKFTMSGLTPDGVYPVEVTVAGKPNDNVGGNTSGTGVGATKMYIKFDGWAVNATEPTSYLSKNLDDLSTGADLGRFHWNHSDYNRSYWGESVQYGTTPKLNYTTWSMADKNPITEPLYSFECTNQPEYIANGMNVITKNVTHVVFAATVYTDEAATEAETLVLYNGVYFQEAQFLKYVLNSLQKAGQLNYYIKTSETYVPVEGYTPTVVGEYRQIGLNEVKIVKKTNGTTGEIIVTSNLQDGTNLYRKDGDTFTEITTDAIATLNTLLANFTASVPATGFKGGKMVYYVPVEHLLEILSTQNELEEGNYGVVRNHWYDIRVNKVFRLGEGVFEPGTGTEEDPGEPLIPENPNGDTFGLGARVNILSWKIVKQNVDL